MRGHINMKKYFILFIIMFIISSNCYALNGVLRFGTNYGYDKFEMGWGPIQDRWEISSKLMLSTDPLTIGQFSLLYEGGLLLHDGFTDESEIDAHKMGVSWDKYWGDIYGRLYTELYWYWENFYGIQEKSVQIIGGKVAFLYFTNPYIKISREYDNYEFTEYEMGVEQFVATFYEHTRFFVKGSVNYLSFDDFVGTYTSVDVDFDLREVIIGQMINDPYRNWHSYEVGFGVAYHNQKYNIDIVPSLSVIGPFNNDGKTKMLYFGDTDLLWIPTLNIYYIF